MGTNLVCPSCGQEYESFEGYEPWDECDCGKATLVTPQHLRATQWQPISTLPEKGEPGDMVALLFKGGDGIFYRAIWSEFDDNWWAMDSNSRLTNTEYYTHWIPLPPVPEGE